MNLMNQAFCQCCGMPMTDELHGNNAGGGRNEDYCTYCFKDGAFTFQGSMEEMIQLCVPHMTAANPDMTADKARAAMLQWFPTLKRWNRYGSHHG